MDDNRKLKYFCEKCEGVKPSATTPVFTEGSSIPVDMDVIIALPNKKHPENNGHYRGRKLSCGHFIGLDIPGFTDPTSENLNEFETLHLRNKLDKEMINKTTEEIKQIVLQQVEFYQLFLKISSKQKQQAKYAIQYLQERREQLGKLLSPEEKISLDMKFAHFLGDRPVPKKTIEREKKTTKKAVSQEQDAITKMHLILNKTGYSLKDLFGKKNPEERKGE